MSIRMYFHTRQSGFELDVELEIPIRGVSALFGPSGCGKTSLLRAIAGLDKHRKGYLKIGDQYWQQDKLFTPPHEREIGYVFQQPSLFSHLTVRQNIEYGYRRINKVKRTLSLQQAIDLTALNDLLERMPTHLSGGEQQRVAIARALAVNPRLLLLDEPLSALDRQRKQEILPYIKSLHDELDIPVIYVSHAADEVAQLADNLVLMKNGKIEASGHIQHMLTRLDLELARDADAAALIEAVVADHDDEYQLTYLDFSGGRISVPRQALSTGEQVRLRIVARDVSLTLQHQQNTSILNIFPARVMEIVAEGSAQMMVKLDAGGTKILSRITKKSATLLDLSPGKQVFVQAKSVALLS